MRIWRLYNASGRPKQASSRAGSHMGSLVDLPAVAAGPIWEASTRSDIMSAAEQLEDGRGRPAPRRDPLMEAEAVSEERGQSPATGGPKLRPLLALAPYMMRYRGRALLAFISL